MNAEGASTLLSQTQRIAALNDQHRTGGHGGRIKLSATLQAWPQEALERAILAVERYNDFTPDTDPWGERDLGMIRVDGCDLIWKIDLYDACGGFCVIDPADDTATFRTLTLLVADEV